VNAQDTSAEPKPDLPLEIAHLLLIDVVGYSKLLVNEQIELLQELNQIGDCARGKHRYPKLRIPDNIDEQTMCDLELNFLSRDVPMRTWSRRT